MKKLLFVALTLFFATACFAQTQKGYVKTKGRLDNEGKLMPGTPLSEVVVKVKDRNEVMSDKRGDFSFPMPDQTYYLESVSKNGYVLIDPDLLSKQYSYSKNKLVIALETKDQQIEERMDNFRKINEAQNAMITKLRAEVKQLKKENKITEEEYYKRLQEIVDMQNESQKLVEEMVDRYSKMDFDQLSEFELQIKSYILSGDLLKAKNMIMSKGDLTERAEDLKRHLEANAKEREEITKRSRKLEKSELAAQKKLDDLAKDYYDLFEIYKLEHKNDSAAYYLEERVKLDTTKVEWMNDVATFVRLYLADYDLALNYYTSSLHNINLQNIKNYEQLASVNNNIGHVYHHLGDLQNAKEYYELAIDNLKNVSDPNNNIVSYYNNLGTVYCDMGMYDKSLEYHSKALNILIQNHIEDSIRYTSTYNNLGSVYCYLNDYNKALDFYLKTLHIQENYGDSKLLEMAVSYSNIAYVYDNLNKFDLAIEFNNKAIEIREKILGEEHPDIAQSYNNIGYVYLKMRDLSTALEYMKKAVGIYKNIIGEQHQNIATFYNNIAIVYIYMGNLDMALEYTIKSLEIRKAIYKNEHEDIATSYSNLAAIYFKMGNIDKAVEYNAMALDIYLGLFGYEHSSTATCYNNLGVMVETSGDYEKALEYYNMALDVRLKLLGPNNLDVAGTYGNIGGIYYTTGNLQKADEYYQKNLTIYKSILGEDNPQTIKVKNRLEEVQAKLKESKKK